MDAIGFDLACYYSADAMIARGSDPGEVGQDNVENESDKTRNLLVDANADYWELDLAKFGAGVSTCSPDEPAPTDTEWSHLCRSTTPFGPKPQQAVWLGSIAIRIERGHRRDGRGIHVVIWTIPAIATRVDTP